MPYQSHSAMPMQKMPNIHHEMSCAERVFTMRKICGTNAIVVSAPAAKSEEVLRGDHGRARIRAGCG